jgi:uncharacterized protein YdhG (YjbR/CyaY superfamily)
MKKPTNINEYIAMFPKDVAARLKKVRAAVRVSALGAVEGLKWGMPSFSYKRILVNFAGFKHHVGLYPTPSATKAFTKEISKYKSGRGSIQFPHDKPLPIPLIKRIVRFRVKESLDKDKKWKEK